MESSTKSVQLPPFDGREEKFQIWWTKFIAYACVYAFAKSLKTQPEADLPASMEEEFDGTTTEGKKMAAMSEQELEELYEGLSFPSGLKFKRAVESAGGKITITEANKSTATNSTPSHCSPQSVVSANTAHAHA